MSVNYGRSGGRHCAPVQKMPVAVQSFNSFVRHAAVVKMSNFTMLTSLLSSDPKKGTCKSPLFYIFKAFSNNCLGDAIDSYIVCDTFNTEKYKGIAFLDVSTSYSRQSKTMLINVVNRHKDKAIPTDITNLSGALAGNAEVSLISSSELQEAFSFDKQNDYIPVKKNIATKGNMLLYTFPPHSFTQIKIALK